MCKLQLVVILLSCLLTPNAGADWKDLLDKVPDSVKDVVSSSDAAGAAGLSAGEMAAGLKEALNTATAIAVDELSKEGGFLDNSQVRIPIPEKLDWLEKGLRTLGKEDMADEFVTTMNRAAEQAVPVALEQFQSAINAMTLEDAQGILKGADDAATQYFRKHSETSLREQFLPIVKKTTDQTGVTASYKSMTKKVGGLSSLLNTESLDVDEYVTEQALDGLFTIVAQEEARIREDPIARTTDLLKKVFGSQ